MKTKEQIEQKTNELIFQLPEAKAGMPAHLIREKIKLLKWIQEEN